MHADQIMALIQFGGYLCQPQNGAGVCIGELVGYQGKNQEHVLDAMDQRALQDQSLSMP